MDRTEKQRRLKDWKRQQRQAARAALPASDAHLAALFESVAAALQMAGCDKIRALTLKWIRRSGLSEEALLRWLDSTGGFCDCEVATNSRQEWEQTRFRPAVLPGGRADDEQTNGDTDRGS